MRCAALSRVRVEKLVVRAMSETLLSDPYPVSLPGRPSIGFTAKASNAWCCSALVRAGIQIYDVAVFLKNLGDRCREIDRLAAIETDIPAETGAFIHAMPYHAGSYRERTPLMHEIRREGIDL